MSEETFSGGLTFREVLGLASMAYSGASKKGLCYKIPTNTAVASEKVWQVYDVFEGVDYKFRFFNKAASYRAILVNRLDNLEFKILVFSGSDSPFSDWGDWWMDNAGQAYNGTSTQYMKARKLAGEINPNMMIGHSLGGGLASYASIHTGIKSLTVNPAPLNVSVSGALMNRAEDKVINFVAQGEALDLLQDISYQAKINESIFKNLPSFSLLSNACRNYKLTKTVPYMRRVGRDVYKPSKASNFAMKHLLDNFEDYKEPIWEGGKN